MHHNDKAPLQLTEADLPEIRSTFPLDVLSHVINALKHCSGMDKLSAEDLLEDHFWLGNSQHEYRAGKFLETVDVLVDLDLLHITKYGTDLNGDSLYQRTPINF